MEAATQGMCRRARERERLANSVGKLNSAALPKSRFVAIAKAKEDNVRTTRPTPPLRYTERRPLVLLLCEVTPQIPRAAISILRQT